MNNLDYIQFRVESWRAVEQELHFVLLSHNYAGELWLHFHVRHAYFVEKDSHMMHRV